MKYDYLKENYSGLTANIGNVCSQIGRNYEDVKLVAVSKTFSTEEILQVNKLGHLDFGENKVQELKSKYESLKSENINWHLVGHLQTNKVKYIVDFVSLVHSVDSCKLAVEIDKYAKKQGETIMDLESQTVVTVKNPLSILAVKGFDDLPYIESIKIKIYLYTFHLKSF